MMATSEELFDRARKVIPGGVNSPVRAFRGVGGVPRFIASGLGSRIRDVDGREYIDLVGSWGPLILGHRHPEVEAAIAAALRRGTTFGAPTEAEVELAEAISLRMPSVERVRLTSSGTEACLAAVRLARGFTGRDRIVKFEGCYHGHGDSFLIKSGSGALTLGVPSSPGVPGPLAALTLSVRYNDLDATRSAFASRGEDIAAVIVEPVVGNMGTVPPKPGFLQGLREICDAFGALLIFDEVMTGFRVARGGAQELYGVRPDITALGKVVGGGLPLAAFGGRAEILETLAPGGPVYHAGTLSGNPLATAAGLKTLEVLGRPGAYERLEALGSRLENGLGDVVAGLPASSPFALTFQRVGSMATLFFAKGPVESLDSLADARIDLYARLFHGCLRRGVYLPPSQYEAFFLSLAHTDAEIDETVGVVAAALRDLR